MNEDTLLSWACTNAKEHIWILGVVVDNSVSYAEAVVKRRQDGSWEWQLIMHIDKKGIEPSCDEAKQSAERALWKTALRT